MEQTSPSINLWSDGVRQEPHAVYARLRQEARLRGEAAVHRAVGPVTGNTLWFMLGYDDAVAALKHDNLVKDRRKIASQEELAAMARDPSAILNRHMLTVDPPDHTRLRALVHKAFTPRMVRDLGPHIEEIASALLDEMAQDSEGDLIARYAFPLPMIVIAELLGVPPEERDQFRDWTKVLLYEMELEKRGVAAMELVRYFQGVFEARRQEPRDDLITGLVQAEEAGERLDPQELVSMVFLLLVAGHETTVNLIGNGTLELLRHPDQLALLREADFAEELVESAVEELLRFHGPVENALARWVYEDMEWNGHVLRRGELVFATLMSANRDEAAFDAPDTLNITRQPNRHIAFGQGIHYCLGAPLARLEGAIALRALLARFPDLQLAVASEKLEWADNITLRGLKRLPLRW